MMHINSRLAVIITASVLATSPVLGGSITITGPAPQNYKQQASHPSLNGNVELHPQSVTYIPSASTKFRNTLSDQFPDWTFSYAGGLSGTLNIDAYKAYANDGYGGAEFRATYTRGTGDPALADLYWIQMVDTGDPIVPGMNPVIDPILNDTNETPVMPFYWDINGDDPDYHDSTHKTSSTYKFIDVPAVPYPNPPPFPHFTRLYWTADLMLASWDGTLNNGVGSVTIHDGIRWGFYHLVSHDPPRSAADAVRFDRRPAGLAAVPEPASLALVSLGGPAVAAFVLFRRRNR
ncbi:PEP-CTERM sorting domain-containing protein [Tautonia sociabilis]|uniref:PEP-CTERM sorting domain-containing protein n=1 Tax=Tautonia sociabilis TaxID=2080755 RepID=A0A432MLF4_9BACT|nr:PEP-CTERM sorting domain-containing protein [Tautonia sociabilis]RUL88037.1 PEP-CTERM sorting domain-containing protein [Tautonia sociabilis]